MTNNRMCKGCSNIIEISEDRRKSRVYCSDGCRDSVCRPKRAHDLESLSKNARGSWGEIVVIADLIRKGYYVFKSVMSNCPCDVIAMKNNRLYRVEITLAKRVPDGVRFYAKHNSKNYDILALVYETSDIEYIEENSL